MYEVHILCIWLNPQEYIEQTENGGGTRHVAFTKKRYHLFYVGTDGGIILKQPG